MKERQEAKADSPVRMAELAVCKYSVCKNDRPSRLAGVGAKDSECTHTGRIEWCNTMLQAGVNCAGAASQGHAFGPPRRVEPLQRQKSSSKAALERRYCT